MNAAAYSSTNLTMMKSGLELLAMTKAKAAILAGVCAAITIGAVLVYEPRQPDSGGRLRLPVGKGIPAIRMGGSHGLILASDGSLWSWGTNYVGWPVLGLGKIQTQKSLHRIGSETDWIGISSSSTHNLALKADGSMWAWGENLSGELGRGAPGRGDRMQSTPVPSAPGNDWGQVAAGGSHSLALKQDGTLWAWGNNSHGRLGIGSTDKKVYEVTQVGTVTNWTKVWSAGVQSVGQQSDGSLWFWGSLTGSSEDTNCFFVPTRVSDDTNWVDVGFGYFMVFAIKADGTLWAWGRNAGIYTGTPIQLLNPTPARVGTESNWQACSSSGSFGHLLQKKDGSLWILDASDYSRVNKASYRPIEFRRVNLQKEIAAFGAAGLATGVALTKDGEVWTWGRVFGEFTPARPQLQSLAKALGWKTKRFDSKPVIRDEPWLLPNTE
jgi:alpha-tubulin suppressor-like RCC1 family protein